MVESELAHDPLRLRHELLQRRLGRAGLSSAVRYELLRNPGHLPSQEAVASALYVSVRTLRRQLAEEDTSFRALVDETRLLLAEELLRTGRLSVEAIAERLGYAESASFVRAFVRWTGMPPRRWARQHAL